MPSLLLADGRCRPTSIGSHAPLPDEVVGVAQPLGQPLDSLVRRASVQSVPGCISVAGRLGTEQELTEELVLPGTETKAPGRVAVGSHDGQRLERRKHRARPSWSRGHPGTGG